MEKIVDSNIKLFSFAIIRIFKMHAVNASITSKTIAFVNVLYCHA